MYRKHGQGAAGDGAGSSTQLLKGAILNPTYGCL